MYHHVQSLSFCTSVIVVALSIDPDEHVYRTKFELFYS